MTIVEITIWNKVYNKSSPEEEYENEDKNNLFFYIVDVFVVKMKTEEQKKTENCNLEKWFLKEMQPQQQ